MHLHNVFQEKEMIDGRHLINNTIKTVVCLFWIKHIVFVIILTITAFHNCSVSPKMIMKFNNEPQ